VRFAVGFWSLCLCLCLCLCLYLCVVDLRYCEPAIVPLGSTLRLQRDSKTSRSFEAVFARHAAAELGTDRTHLAELSHEFVKLREHQARLRVYAARTGGTQQQQQEQEKRRRRWQRHQAKGAPAESSSRVKSVERYNDNLAAFSQLCGWGTGGSSPHVTPLKNHWTDVGARVNSGSGGSRSLSQPPAYAAGVPPVPATILSNFVEGVVTSASELYAFKVRCLCAAYGGEAVRGWC
jgi:hypothetical protein